MNFLKIKNKLLFCSENIWRKIFLAKQSIVFLSQEKLIYQRSSIIPKIFLKYETSIYSGKRWTKRNINKWIVGYKFGEFTWNKKIAIYKAKQLKKKKKKLIEIRAITSNLLSKRILFCRPYDNF